MDGFDGLLRETMILTAMLCIPVLGVAALVGTAVAIVQAATQVQEQTIALFPKVIAVGLCVSLFGAFAMHGCATLFQHALDAIPSLVGSR
jgi:flagellar biosynthetic protein FliQ